MEKAPNDVLLQVVADEQTGANTVKTALWALYGAALGLVYGSLAGILLIQIIGIRGGAVFGLDNVLTAVMPPQVPVLPTLAVVALTCLVFVGVTAGIARRRFREQIAAVAGFVVLVLAVVIGSLVLSGWRVLDEESRGVITRGPLGWIEVAGADPLMASMALLVLGSLLYRLRRSQRASGEASAPPRR